MSRHLEDSEIRMPREGLIEIFQRMAAGGEDPLHLIADLFAAMRPCTKAEFELAAQDWRRMLAVLEENAEWRQALAATMLQLFSMREQRRFYTEAGLLPNTGFFSELQRKLVHKILPELVDQKDLKDCIHIIFCHARDQNWMEQIPKEDRSRFWEVISLEPVNDPAAHQRMKQQLLDSAVILVYRVAAMGIEPELQRVLPRLAAGASPFIALADELVRMIETLADSSADQVSNDDLCHFEVLMEQCRGVVQRAHQAAASKGTSMTLTFLVVRLHQHLERLELLIRLLSVRPSAANQSELNERWSEFFLSAVSGERLRNSLRRHFSDLLVLMSLRVTENAGKTGEHYIAQDRTEWMKIGKAAAGAGFFIACMALMKLKGATLELPVFSHGLMNGLIYGGGFALIHMLHFIVATKQPAMTAATIAATVSQVRGRLRETERLSDLAVGTVRGQIAAISGNVLVALPVALLLSLAAGTFGGEPLITDHKAAHLLGELDPFGATLIYAATAGVWLFMAGLVSGYFDNVTAYSRIGERVTNHPLLLRIFGERLTAKTGDYLDRNAGGLAGNLFFGMMLGMTPALGQAFGLPLDIRHIAFSSANLGYALITLNFKIGWLAFINAVAGVALIGAVNLLVSFALALYVALRSHGVSFASALQLIPSLWRRLKLEPFRFFVPGRKA